ncbi:aminopeptidase [Psychrosphaera saromensis]|uniref:Aminopeptidase n=1 Tax=Psychrosphaera saromensis TaxID=716813 RepID=A0A2S7UXU7_9GAMM|nr:M28 family metallopeptidase [Psychrosphaera saromensis]PQJ54091.1 aminopeptidase [Psychrosphaera saromensis]GHB76730.1 aminopeptidase [Psychrosphaera saromensis]GLQ14411.1 aminopeptidase [Psychrosphaera saromensis]
MKYSLSNTWIVLSVFITSHPLFAQDLLQQDENIWITIDPIAAKHYTNKNSLINPNNNVLQAQNTLLDTVNVMEVNQQDINQLSEFMHDNYHRCGGFVAHDSLAEAKLYTQQLANVENQTINTLAVSYSINNGQTVQQLINSINSSNLTNTVDSMSAFYNRYYTQQTGADASQWLKDYWQQLASARSDISVDFFNHSWAQSSVIVTIPGSEKADEIVIIGGHLDSINQSNASDGRAPGADDNGSGIAVLSEALRAIVDNNYTPQRTIKIMGFAAEEVGLRGSKAIAEDYKAQGKNVVGMVQFDMTGNFGSTEDIVMMTDYTNAAQNQFLGQLIDTYLPTLTYGFDQCGYGCSDHASWYQQGFAASIPFESRMADINPRIHTENDTSFNAEHASKFAKLAVTYLAEIAKNSGDETPPATNVLENGVTVSGINGIAKEQIFFTLPVPTSSTNLNFTTSGGTGDADLYVKFDQQPTLQDFDCKSTTASSNESCDINNAQEGTYHVMVEAWGQISGVSLTGSYSNGSTGGTDPINRTESNVSVASGVWARYTQELGVGYSSLEVSISGGSGDADLYVNFGSASSTSSYECRPYKNGNSETCTIDNPQAGIWYIDLRGYSSASGLTLTINAQ